MDGKTVEGDPVEVEDRIQEELEAIEQVRGYR
jgi:hypothetical protein